MIASTLPYKSSQEFEEDVKNCCGVLFNKYGFKVIKTQEHPLESIIESPTCGLSFVVLEYQDQWYSTFSFFIPKYQEKNTQEYMPDDVYKSIYNKKSDTWPTPVENQEFKNNREKIKVELSLLAEYIEKYFKSVLNGDFSWIKNI